MMTSKIIKDIGFKLEIEDRILHHAHTLSRGTLYFKFLVTHKLNDLASVDAGNKAAVESRVVGQQER